MLAAIDKGLTDLFAVARKNRYKKRLSYSDYTVYIAKADRQKNADGNYSPDIAVGRHSMPERIMTRADMSMRQVW